MLYQMVPCRAISNSAMPCHIKQSHAGPYQTVPCHAISNSAMPCHIKRCHAVPYDQTVPCRIVSNGAMPCHIKQCHAGPYQTVPCRAISNSAMPGHIKQCHARLYPIVLLYSPLSCLLKSHMHLTQYVDQVCMICGSVKVTLCPLTSSVDGVCTCTTPSTHISVDLVIVL